MVLIASGSPLGEKGAAVWSISQAARSRRWIGEEGRMSSASRWLAGKVSDKIETKI